MLRDQRPGKRPSHANRFNNRSRTRGTYNLECNIKEVQGKVVNELVTASLHTEELGSFMLDKTMQTRW